MITELIHEQFKWVPFPDLSSNRYLCSSFIQIVLFLSMLLVYIRFHERTSKKKFVFLVFKNQGVKNVFFGLFNSYSLLASILVLGI